MYHCATLATEAFNKAYWRPSHRVGMFTQASHLTEQQWEVHTQ